jgi:hypothetical protein
MRSGEGSEKQGEKGNFKRDNFKGKKGPKAMHSDTWDEDEKEGDESEIGPSNDGPSPFCFMAQVNLEDAGEEEDDFDAIIATNELTDPTIIEYLRKLHLAKKRVEKPTKVTIVEEVTKEEKKEETPQEDMVSSSSAKEVQDERKEEASSSNSKNENAQSKVEASSSPPLKEAKVYLNSNLIEDEPIHVSYCASVSDSDDEYDDIEDASISTNERMLKFELARANKLLNETNQALLRSEGTNEGLTKKVLELESKVTEFEAKEIIFEKQRKDFVQQISNLKIDKQLLDVENRALKSTSASSSGTRMDSTNLYKGQKSQDKTGLGYKRILPSLQSSKNPTSPKEKGKQIQVEKGMHGKTQNSRNAPNYAFRYNPAWSKNIYHRTPTGWRYEVKGKQAAQFDSKLDERSRIVSQQIKSSNKNKDFKPKTQVQSLKDDYHNRFVKVVVNPPTSALCNYCCKHGHISFECKYRKGSNMHNVAWVPKIKH